MTAADADLVAEENEDDASERPSLQSPVPGPRRSGNRLHAVSPRPFCVWKLLASSPPALVSEGHLLLQRLRAVGPRGKRCWARRGSSWLRLSSAGAGRGRRTRPGACVEGAVEVF